MARRQNHRDEYPAPSGYADALAGVGWKPPDLKALKGNSAASMSGHLGMVKWIDEALGRMLDALRSLGRLENAVVCFTSDHGCHFRIRNGEYNRSGHEASIWIPLVIHGSGFMSVGTRRELVSLIDVPRTLLAAAGLSAVAEMQGRSVLPLLRGETAGWPEEVFLQVREMEVGRVVGIRR